MVTALHIVQSETGLQPFSGDQPLPGLLSSLDVTTGSLPSFYMNVLHTDLCCYRVFRGAAALVACLHLQL